MIYKRNAEVEKRLEDLAEGPTRPVVDEEEGRTSGSMRPPWADSRRVRKKNILIEVWNARPALPEDLFSFFKPSGINFATKAMCFDSTCIDRKIIRNRIHKEGGGTA